MNPSWFRNPVQSLSQTAMQAARQRQARLLKPLGSLGRLEDLVVQLAGMQGTPAPTLERARLVLFAGDHGVAEARVSAYPQTTTGTLLQATAEGRSVAGVMSRAQELQVELVDVGTRGPEIHLAGVVRARVGNATLDIRHAPAMTEAQFTQALQAGRAAVQRAAREQVRIVLLGDIGIANTTAAAAVAAALMGVAPESLAGPGSGLDETGMARKAQAIQDAMARHRPFLNTPLSTLRHLGGFELAALCGAMIACAQEGIPALLDGFTTSVAALVAIAAKPPIKEWLLFSHRAAEPGQYGILKVLDASPYLELGMSLGEGTGALSLLPLMRQACLIHNETATLDEVGVTSETP